MQQNNYELSVCVNGRPIREYGHKGLTYVEGRHGHHYSIKFRNNTAARVMAVVSADGLDVVDGKPATNDSRGYIVPGYQSIEIHGWRMSKSKVADFMFDTKPRAYSTQSQKSDLNCGVIAVKVFNEMFDLSDFVQQKTVIHEWHTYHHHLSPPAPVPIWNPYTITCNAASSNAPSTYACNVNSILRSVEPNSSLAGEVKATSLSCSNSGGDSLSAGQAQNSVNFVAPAPTPAPVQETPSFNLGTGWGKERIDEVEEVKFKRGIEMATLEIYYSDAQGLKDAGIEVDKKPAVSKPTLPKAFHGFCTPPVVTSS